MEIWISHKPWKQGTLEAEKVKGGLFKAPLSFCR